MIYSLISFAAAVATFFLVPLPWYFALAIALLVLIGTGVLRAAYWIITKQDTASVVDRAIHEAEAARRRSAGSSPK
jgi:hypothetical protein